MVNGLSAIMLSVIKRAKLRVSMCRYNKSIKNQTINQPEVKAYETYIAP
jgi:hypothetical protein